MKLANVDVRLSWKGKEINAEVKKYPEPADDQYLHDHPYWMAFKEITFQFPLLIVTITQNYFGFDETWTTLLLKLGVNLVSAYFFALSHKKPSGWKKFWIGFFGFTLGSCFSSPLLMASNSGIPWAIAANISLHLVYNGIVSLLRHLRISHWLPLAADDSGELDAAWKVVMWGLSSWGGWRIDEKKHLAELASVATAEEQITFINHLPIHPSTLTAIYEFYFSQIEGVCQRMGLRVLRAAIRSDIRRKNKGPLDSPAVNGPLALSYIVRLLRTSVVDIYEEANATFHEFLTLKYGPQSPQHEVKIPGPNQESPVVCTFSTPLRIFIYLVARDHFKRKDPIVQLSLLRDKNTLNPFYFVEGARYYFWAIENFSLLPDPEEWIADIIDATYFDAEFATRNAASGSNEKDKTFSPKSPQESVDRFKFMLVRLLILETRISDQFHLSIIHQLEGILLDKIDRTSYENFLGYADNRIKDELVEIASTRKHSALHFPIAELFKNWTRRLEDGRKLTAVFKSVTAANRASSPTHDPATAEKDRNLHFELRGIVRPPSKEEAEKEKAEKLRRDAWDAPLRFVAQETKEAEAELAVLVPSMTDGVTLMSKLPRGWSFEIAWFKTASKLGFNNWAMDWFDPYIRPILQWLYQQNIPEDRPTREEFLQLLQAYLDSARGSNIYINLNLLGKQAPLNVKVCLEFWEKLHEAVLDSEATFTVLINNHDRERWRYLTRGRKALMGFPPEPDKTPAVYFEHQIIHPSDVELLPRVRDAVFFEAKTAPWGPGQTVAIPLKGNKPLSNFLSELQKGSPKKKKESIFNGILITAEDSPGDKTRGKQSIDPIPTPSPSVDENVYSGSYIGTYSLMAFSVLILCLSLIGLAPPELKWLSFGVMGLTLDMVSGRRNNFPDPRLQDFYKSGEGFDWALYVSLMKHLNDLTNPTLKRTYRKRLIDAFNQKDRSVFSESIFAQVVLDIAQERIDDGFPFEPAPVEGAERRQAGEKEQGIVESVNNAFDAMGDSIGRLSLGSKQNLAFLENIGDTFRIESVSAAQPDKRVAAVFRRSEQRTLRLRFAWRLNEGEKPGSRTILQRARPFKKENVRTYLFKKLQFSRRGPATFQGKLLNPLDRLEDLEGRPVSYRLGEKTARIDFSDRGRTLTVADDGKGIDVPTLLFVFPVPGASPHPSNLDRSTDYAQDRAHADAGGIFLAPRTDPAETLCRVALLIGGTEIETLEFTGAHLPSLLVLDLPASAWRTSSGEQLILNGVALDFLRSAVDRIADHFSRRPAELAAVANAMELALQRIENEAGRTQTGFEAGQGQNYVRNELEERLRSKMGETIKQLDREQWTLLPADSGSEILRPEFLEGKRAVHLSSTLFHFNPASVGGKLLDATGKTVWSVPGLLAPCLRVGESLLLDAESVEFYRQYAFPGMAPILFNLLFSIWSSYGHRPPAEAELKPTASTRERSALAPAFADSLLEGLSEDDRIRVLPWIAVSEALGTIPQLDLQSKIEKLARYLRLFLDEHQDDLESVLSRDFGLIDKKLYGTHFSESLLPEEIGTGVIIYNEHGDVYSAAKDGTVRQIARNAEFNSFHNKGDGDVALIKLSDRKWAFVTSDGASFPITGLDAHQLGQLDESNYKPIERYRIGTEQFLKLNLLSKEQILYRILPTAEAKLVMSSPEMKITPLHLAGHYFVHLQNTKKNIHRLLRLDENFDPIAIQGLADSYLSLTMYDQEGYAIVFAYSAGRVVLDVLGRSGEISETFLLDGSEGSLAHKAVSFREESYFLFQKSIHDPTNKIMRFKPGHAPQPIFSGEGEISLYETNSDLLWSTNQRIYRKMGNSYESHSLPSVFNAFGNFFNVGNKLLALWSEPSGKLRLSWWDDLEHPFVDDISRTAFGRLFSAAGWTIFRTLDSDRTNYIQAISPNGKMHLIEEDSNSITLISIGDGVILATQHKLVYMGPGYPPDSPKVLLENQYFIGEPGLLGKTICVPIQPTRAERMGLYVVPLDGPQICLFPDISDWKKPKIMQPGIFYLDEADNLHMALWPSLESISKFNPAFDANDISPWLAPSSRAQLFQNLLRADRDVSLLVAVLPFVPWEAVKNLSDKNQQMVFDVCREVPVWVAAYVVAPFLMRWNWAELSDHSQQIMQRWLLMARRQPGKTKRVLQWLDHEHTIDSQLFSGWDLLSIHVPASTALLAPLIIRYLRGELKLSPLVLSKKKTSKQKPELAEPVLRGVALSALAGLRANTSLLDGKVSNDSREHAPVALAEISTALGNALKKGYGQTDDILRGAESAKSNDWIQEEIRDSLKASIRADSSHATDDQTYPIEFQFRPVIEKGDKLFVEESVRDYGIGMDLYELLHDFWPLDRSSFQEGEDPALGFNGRGSRKFLSGVDYARITTGKHDSDTHLVIEMKRGKDGRWKVNIQHRKGNFSGTEKIRRRNLEGNYQDLEEELKLEAALLSDHIQVSAGAVPQTRLSLNNENISENPELLSHVEWAPGESINVVRTNSRQSRFMQAGFTFQSLRADAELVSLLPPAWLDIFEKEGLSFDLPSSKSTHRFSIALNMERNGLREKEAYRERLKIALFAAAAQAIDMIVTKEGRRVVDLPHVLNPDYLRPENPAATRVANILNGKKGWEKLRSTSIEMLLRNPQEIPDFICRLRIQDPDGRKISVEDLRRRLINFARAKNRVAARKELDDYIHGYKGLMALVSEALDVPTNLQVLGSTMEQEVYRPENLARFPLSKLRNARLLAALISSFMTPLIRELGAGPSVFYRFGFIETYSSRLALMGKTWLLLRGNGATLERYLLWIEEIIKPGWICRPSDVVIFMELLMDLIHENVHAGKRTSHFDPDSHDDAFVNEMKTDAMHLLRIGLVPENLLRDLIRDAASIAEKNPAVLLGFEAVKSILEGRGEEITQLPNVVAHPDAHIVELSSKRIYSIYDPYAENAVFALSAEALARDVFEKEGQGRQFSSQRVAQTAGYFLQETIRNALQKFTKQDWDAHQALAVVNTRLVFYENSVSVEVRNKGGIDRSTFNAEAFKKALEALEILIFMFNNDLRMSIESPGYQTRVDRLLELAGITTPTDEQRRLVINGKGKQILNQELRTLEEKTIRPIRKIIAVLERGGQLDYEKDIFPLLKQKLFSTKTKEFINAYVEVQGSKEPLDRELGKNDGVGLGHVEDLATLDGLSFDMKVDENGEGSTTFSLTIPKTFFAESGAVVPKSHFIWDLGATLLAFIYAPDRKSLFLLVSTLLLISLTLKILKTRIAKLELSRQFGRLVALLLLPVAGVVILLVAIPIKLDSPGPVLFHQQRLGYKSQIFHHLENTDDDEPIGSTAHQHESLELENTYDRSRLMNCRNFGTSPEEKCNGPDPVRILLTSWMKITLRTFSIKLVLARFPRSRRTIEWDQCFIL